MMVGWYIVLMFISLNVCTLTYSDVHTSAIQKPEPENMILGFGISGYRGRHIDFRLPVRYNYNHNP